MKTSEKIDMFDKKVMYGFDKYEDGVILYRFEEGNITSGKVFYTEQKIHIDNKVLETIKGWLNE